MWTRPSYQVHTYTDHKHGVLPVANVIPVDVQAYVTMRIVPDQDPHEIFRLFSQEVRRRLAEIPGLNPEAHLTIELESAAYPFNTDVSGPEFSAVANAMAQAFDVSEVDFMGCGGTEPIALYYQRILGVPVVFNAYNSPADNYHGHDESMSLERGFQPGVVANVLIYQNLYRLRNPQDPSS